MKSESGINNRWDMLQRILEVKDLKHSFNAYGWFENEHLRISKDEHWCGFWNDCFDFVSVFPKTNYGKKLIQSIRNAFIQNGYSIRPIINHGISICYETMSRQESHEKALNNLLNGGRLSD